MANKQSNSDNHQLKKDKSTGEQRNGRLSQFKNHNMHDEEAPNEYISKKDHDD